MAAKKILLAEDDDDDRLFFRDFLEDRQDIDLLPPAENGLELLKVLNEAKGRREFPDLIILDQNMPKLNGLQTLEQIRQDAALDHIPVFVYSTYTSDDLVKSCTNLGAALVISKPADKAGYLKMIDAFFIAAGI